MSVGAALALSGSVVWAGSLAWFLWFYDRLTTTDARVRVINLSLAICAVGACAIAAGVFLMTKP